MQAFLDQIGSVNAAHLSHLSINFPVAESQEGTVVLRESDLWVLKLLQEKCSGLATLEALVQDGNSQFVQEALAQIDAQFKSIPSLPKIIIRFYGGSPAPAAAELMQRYDWVILPGR